MADITMCTQTLCPNSGHCYRVQAKKSDWQSMATFDYTISVRGVECDNYMPKTRNLTIDNTCNPVFNRPHEQPLQGLSVDAQERGCVGC